MKEKDIREIGKEKGLSSLCMKHRGLCLDILRVSMVGVFLHVRVRDGAEDFLITHFMVKEFPRIKALDRDEDFFLFLRFRHLRVLAFGTVVTLVCSFQSKVKLSHNSVRDHDRE